MGKYRILGTYLDRLFRNDLNANFDDVDKDIQSQKERVDDLIKAVPQPSEVVDSRGGFPVLRDRLQSVDTQLAQKATLRYVDVEEFPMIIPETDDSQRIVRAIEHAISNGRKRLFFDSKTYTINTKITIIANDIEFMGNGFSTVFQNGTNTTMFEIKGRDVHFKDLKIAVTDLNRTNFPVVVSGGERPVFDTVSFDGLDGSYRSGLNFNGGSMGTVENCLFNHSCIRVATWDVKINKTYIWAMSCEYGIGIVNASGNIKVTDTDIVPPLKSFANGRAAIWTEGACYNIHLEVYLDGNPSLNTKEGIIINPDAGNVTILVKANRMDSDVIVIDSAIGVEVYSGKFHNNNDQGIGSREIVIRKTGVQSPHVRIHDNDFIMTRDIVGTKAACIEVESSVTTQDSIEIINNRIKQPPSLNGYTDPEIVCNSSVVNLRGNRGGSSLYFAKGKIDIASSSTSATISFPKAMAYEPEISDYVFQFEGARETAYRVQKNGRNSVFIAYDAVTSAGSIHYKVELSR